MFHKGNHFGEKRRMKIQIINGPNINLLGKREPSIYGARSFEDYLVELKERFPQVEMEYYQSNVEGEMINKIHEVGMITLCSLLILVKFIT